MPAESIPTQELDDEDDHLDPHALDRTLHQMGERERAKAFAAGLSVLVVRSGRFVKLHPDGREEDLGVVPELVPAKQP